MKIVIADASPIHYLVLIGHGDLLREMHTRIVIPMEVFEELTAMGAPATVKRWIEEQGAWLEVRSAPVGVALPDIQGHARLHAGEHAALRLAIVEADSLLLIDDAAGRSAAAKLGIAMIGTLGLLLEAARNGKIDLNSAIARLRSTNFRISQTIIDRLTG